MDVKTSQDTLRIGLHSQTLGGEEVAGSEVTTHGLAQALSSHQVVRIGPGNATVEEKLDLLLIEGYHPSLHATLEKLHHPGLVVLFWCLSTYGFEKLASLPIDGMLTNSPHLQFELPTAYLPLAADTKRFKPGDVDPKLRHEVTFVGMRCRWGNASREAMLLEAAAVADLAIYGAGWADHPQLGTYAHGPLLFEKLPALYRSAETVLCHTEERQKELGMINNRIFEAVASGARVISDYSPEIEALFGDEVTYARRPGDVAAALKSGTVRRTDPKVIVAAHQYTHRVGPILELYERVRDGR